MKLREYSDYYLFNHCREYTYYCLGNSQVCESKERAAHWSGLWSDTEDMGE